MRDYVDKITNKFLAWELPDSVKSDICATIPEYKPRYGTNLLNFTEARLMVVHLFSELLDEHENLQKFTTQYEESARDWKANYEELDAENKLLKLRIDKLESELKKWIRDAYEIKKYSTSVVEDCIKNELEELGIEPDEPKLCRYCECVCMGDPACINCNHKCTCEGK